MDPLSNGRIETFLFYFFVKRLKTADFMKAYTCWAGVEHKKEVRLTYISDSTSESSPM